jgi:hypothetical protein
MLEYRLVLALPFEKLFTPDRLRVRVIANLEPLRVFRKVWITSPLCDNALQILLTCSRNNFSPSVSTWSQYSRRSPRFGTTRRTRSLRSISGR